MVLNKEEENRSLVFARIGLYLLFSLVILLVMGLTWYEGDVFTITNYDIHDVIFLFWFVAYGTTCCWVYFDPTGKKTVASCIAVAVLAMGYIFILALSDSSVSNDDPIIPLIKFNLLAMLAWSLLALSLPVNYFLRKRFAW